MEVAFDKFEEQIFLNTALIKNLTKNEIGTGFLMRKVEGEQAKFVLFSNKHVFLGKKYKEEAPGSVVIEITLHKKERGGSYKLGSTENFRMIITQDNKGYFAHPDEDIDVACVDITQAFLLPHVQPNVRTIESQHFSDLDLSKIHCGSEIFFVGYPKGFYDQKHFLPVLRSGVIASIPSVDFDGKKQILIDAPVFPGSSGSPVFVKSGNRYHFLGVISEAVIHDLDFIEISNVADDRKPANIRYPIQFIGLGLAFKYTAVKDILDCIVVNSKETKTK